MTITTSVSSTLYYPFVDVILMFLTGILPKNLSCKMLISVCWQWLTIVTPKEPKFG